MNLVNTQWFESASQYWKWGFNLLPIGSDKKPIMAWDKWQATRQQWQDLEKMPWQKATGLGAVTGEISGCLVCVDFDKVTSTQAPIQLVTALGLPFDYPWLVRSGSGQGYHVWLIADVDLEGANRWNFPGVHEGHIEIRWNKHQTLLPPSCHPSGGQYAFVNGTPANAPTRVRGAALVSAYKSLVVFPVPEIKHSPATIAPVKPANTSQHSGDIDLRRYEQNYVRKALRLECGNCNSAPKGTGSDQLYASAYKIASYVKQGYIDYSEMENALMGTDAARRRPANEAKNTIQSAYKKAAAFKVPEKSSDGSGNKPADPNMAQAPVDEPPPLLNLTDWGNAQRLIHNFGNRVLFCHDWQKWLWWDDTRWQPDRNGTVKRMAKTTVKRIPLEVEQAPTEERQRDVKKWALKSESAGKLEALLRVAESEMEVSATPEDFDADPWLLNCRNGVIDLRTGELMPHDPAMRLMKQVNADYDPAAECPIFDAFLYKIMAGNEDLIEFIWRAIGYSITGSTAEQVAFFLHGGGANGKSTLLNAIRFLLNDYAKNTPTSTLMRKQSNPNGASDDLARLLGVRFVTASETDENQYLSEATVKALTGDDVITARHLYSGNFDFKPVLKIWLACNHKPTITGTDEGIWRRIMLIPFLVKILAHERDGELPRKLENEASGILRRAVNGSLAWQKRGLKEDMPKEVAAAGESYRAEMDVIASFIADCCVVNPNAVAQATPLHTAFEKWAVTNGEKQLSQKTFGSKLAERGFQSRHNSHGYKVWVGLGVKSTDHTD